MFSWSIAVFFLFLHISASSESHYECGPHGKFEYCLSRQPGCVVGCHCHPGYYFDTDTKICEPNLKLTQFRRHYDLEPTRIPIMNIETMTFPTVTITTLSPVDEKVEAIAQDTDDLGDWLYNQFFKTIESQVINNTNSEKLNTRRSGNSPPVTSKKRSHKKSKKGKKKKHIIKKGLRSKLLRITEDDSLFDSSSSESDSSSSESSSDSSDDHDHRKIVMINKKPPPPLPSFIFLPNVDTPFYPPIGLPAPPIAPPMYPMVPVPPVGMMFPWTTESAASKAETPSTTISSTTVSQSTTTQSTPSSIIDNNNNQILGLRNSPLGKHNELQQNSPNKNMDFNNKMLQKIQAKMKKKKKRPQKELDYLEPPFNDIPVDKSSEYHPQSMGDIPKQEDVDFKYLSQLIHKIDLNKTVPRFMANTAPNYGDAFSALTRKSNYQNSAPIYPYNLPNNVNNIPKTLLPTSHKQRPVSKADDMTDSYFTNLGKQIASLIRKINSSSMEQQIDIEIQHQNTPDFIQATNMLSEHRFAQGRSYWERFVRSPLNALSFFKKNDDNNLNNDHLISIENQVNVATAITRPFSLDELENMANIMEEANLKQESIQYYPTQRTTTVNNQYKVNLLPQINRQMNAPITLTRASGEVYRSKQEEAVSMPHQSHSNTVMYPPSKMYPQPKKQDLKITKSNRTKSVVDMNKLKALKRFLQLKPLTNPLHQQVSRIVPRNVTNAKQQMKYNLSPFVLNYKSVNYVNNNHNINKYHMQRSFLPYHLPILKPKTTKTSYFHHESNDFDYFDK